MNQKFTNPKNELTFTKNYTSITASTKLTPMDKLLIARVLNWQQNNLVCTQSNNILASELGVDVKTLKNTITKLNKTPFFKSQEKSHFNEFGAWSNSKEIVIDEEALFEFISNSNIIIEKPIQPEAATEPLKEVPQPAAVAEIIEEIISTELIDEDQDEIQYCDNDLELTFKDIEKIGYSDIKFGANLLPLPFVKYLPLIENKLGYTNRLRKIHKQSMFNLEFSDIIKEVQVSSY